MHRCTTTLSEFQLGWSCFLNVLYVVVFWFQEENTVDKVLMFLAAAKKFYTEPRPFSVKGWKSWEGTELEQIT